MCVCSTWLVALSCSFSVSCLFGPSAKVSLLYTRSWFLSQAHGGTLAIEDMDGGTFTISNGGVFGSLYGTPIINPPQSAILGMHATNDRPVAIDGKVHQQTRHDNRFIRNADCVWLLVCFEVSVR